MSQTTLSNCWTGFTVPYSTMYKKKKNGVITINSRHTARGWCSPHWLWRGEWVVAGELSPCNHPPTKNQEAHNLLLVSSACNHHAYRQHWLWTEPCRCSKSSASEKEDSKNCDLICDSHWAKTKLQRTSAHELWPKKGVARTRFYDIQKSCEVLQAEKTIIEQTFPTGVPMQFTFLSR